MSKSLPDDLTGLRIKHIEVIKKLDNCNHYFCVCHACGKSVVLTRSQLINPSRSSCGCINTAACSNQTLCWSCINSVPKLVDGVYIRGCNWSINKQPVEGWKAKPGIFKRPVRYGSDLPTYTVLECPQYIKSNHK